MKKFKIQKEFWAQPTDLFSKEILKDKPSALDFSRQFTQVYIDNAKQPAGLREIACSRIQFPYIFKDILNNDMIAGHREYGPVGFSPENGDVGYFCNTEMIEKEMDQLSSDSKDRQIWRNILDFWRTESTKSKIRMAYPDEVKKILPSDSYLEDEYAAFPLYRMAGATLNNKKLVDIGISGLREEVKESMSKAALTNKKKDFYKTMIAALDLFSELALLYGSLILDKVITEKDPERISELEEMAEALIHISDKRPETLLQAVQLVWLYNMVAGVINFGRMDTYLADIYTKEADSAGLTRKKALKIMKSMWRMFPANINQFNGRIIIGGADRPEIDKSDRFALLAIETSRQVKDINPQLSLRCYKDMNSGVLELALKAIGEGCTFPMLYNDEVNIDSFAKALDVPLKDAEKYVPFGCGEFVLEHQSFGSPNAIINVLKCVELAMNNGISMLTGDKIGPNTGKFEDFDTYNDFYDAYKKQVEYLVPACATAQDIEYRITGEIADFPYLSLLYDSCVESGKGIFSGGIPHLGATLETYGNTNAADSLTAIKKVIFEDHTVSKKELLKVLKANFRNNTKVHHLLLKAPKYGNDDDYADVVARQIHDHLCNVIKDQKGFTHLDSHLAVIINNEMNTWYGKTCIASADGRLSQSPLAPGNTASGGMDRNGPTALLNSVVRLNPEIHAGTVQNIKFGPDMFTKYPDKFRMLLKTYFMLGGTQLMVTVANQKDLFDALIHPEKYQNLLVRVGGFSARFIDLSPEVQQEIISRTSY